ncbi:substrate-binding domain-containing protein [Streptomyces sp. enrichment culture]|uniref:substrate-binding domain-containing protein n=1 Tax=Streptomyces sp. enrichment culture TaxID=1795815 RepID=UPI003F560FA8
MSIRLADVADRTGVSAATVSRVLNGRPGVAEATRTRVLGAVETLGGTPVATRASRGAMVGVLAQDAGTGAGSSLVDHVLTALHRRGLLPVLFSQAHGAPKAEPASRKLLSHGASGLVFVGGDHADTAADHDFFRSLRDADIPHVLVGGGAFPVQSARISHDVEWGIGKAVRQLSDLGHARIGMISGPARSLTCGRRRDGFLAALHSLGVPAAESGTRIEHVQDFDGAGANAAESLMDRGCTALVCDSDSLALGALRAARSRSLSVPGDLSLVVAGDSATARHMVPSLTVVRPPEEKMAEAAADTLMMAVSGTPLTSLELFFLPDLIIRESTGTAPSF